MYREAIETDTGKQAQEDTDLVSTAIKLFFFFYKGTNHGLLQKHFLLYCPILIFWHTLMKTQHATTMPWFILLSGILWLCVPSGVFLQPPPLVNCHLWLAGCSQGGCHEGSRWGLDDSRHKRTRISPDKCSAGIAPTVLHLVGHTFYRKKN